MGLSLGLSEEASDVFATCTIGVWSRPKRETSCFSSLIGTITRPETLPSCVFIYSIFLDRLFGCPPYPKSIAKTAFWRTKMLLPLFVVTLLIPLVSVCTTCRSSLYCFWDRDDDVDLCRAVKSPVIFMTSVRKMLTALYRITRGKGDLDEYRRQAARCYRIVVGSFVARS